MMPKYRFSAAQRYAVYLAHREKCYICTDPLDVQSMVVDHIIPECLLKTPVRLAEVIKEFGLPENFNLNSYENWAPTHRSCNEKKLAKVFDVTPLIQGILQEAAKRAEQAKDHEARTILKKELSKALNLLQRAIEKGTLDPETEKKLQLLVEDIKLSRDETERSEPIYLTPTCVFEYEYWTCGICGGEAWDGERCSTCGQADGD